MNKSYENMVEKMRKHSSKNDINGNFSRQPEKFQMSEKARSLEHDVIRGRPEFDTPVPTRPNKTSRQ